MFLICLMYVLAAFFQQELGKHMELEQPLTDWLAQAQSQHDRDSDYYQTCGRW